jgi:hypothetical protein
MTTARLALFCTILTAALGASCGGASGSSKPSAAPTGASKSSLPTCHWSPVKPDSEERCTLTSKGEQINITLRDSMRSQDQKQVTVTCVCE